MQKQVNAHGMDPIERVKQVNERAKRHFVRLLIVSALPIALHVLAVVAGKVLAQRRPSWGLVLKWIGGASGRRGTGGTGAGAGSRAPLIGQLAEFDLPP